MRLDYTKVKVLQDAFVSLLNNQFLSDIKFRFADGRIIFAHSFVLCCRSDEFCDSFETTVGVSKMIQVENATYEEYIEFLKYLYTDSCKIDESTLRSVIQLSKKHDLPGLEAKCIDDMLECMSVENVCTTLGMSIELELENLRIQSTKFISENYIAALNAESFLEIRDKALKAILELDPVSDDDEYKVFEATMKWAEKACLKDGLEVSGSLKRQQLGDNLKLLRFGAMTGAEFTACITLEHELLTKDEMLSLFKYVTAGMNNTFGFKDEKRQLILSISDNLADNVVLYDDHTIGNKWKYHQTSIIRSSFNITFSVSQSIAIEDIKWYDYYCYDISWIKFLENSTTIYEGPDKSVVLNSKKILHVNTLYTLKFIHGRQYTRFSSNTDLRFQSESGKCEFTIYKNSIPFIRNLTFNYVNETIHV